MEKRLLKDILMFVALVALIVAGRFLPHAANFTPAAAAGLFAGYWFRNRLVAVSVPLLGMVLSDLLLQMPYHLGTMAIVYGAIALPALLAGGWLRKSDRNRLMQASKVLVGAASGSVLFFVSTNLAVWLFDGMYALNAAGFAACFAAAVPFFKWTLAGDLCFATAIFGGYALVHHFVAARTAKIEAA
jgi:hypothetical protein